MVGERLKEIKVLGAVLEGRRKRGRTQAYESCQRNDMDVDVVENREELSFIPSVVSGWMV